MNDDEKIANEFLSAIGFKNIEYEPNGNIPPDFLVNNKIAIEVRRLNQHTKVYGNEKPLEDIYFKLIPRINNTLKEFEAKEYDTTLIISISYSRPLKVNKALIKQIKESINKNIATGEKGLKVTINENLEMRFYRSDFKLSKSIILGTAIDHNAGGFIVSNIYKNLKLAISEKENKINKFYNNFENWWLILIDHISYGLNENDKKQLLALPKLKTTFEKIFIVSPLNIERVLEINNRGASA